MVSSVLNRAASAALSRPAPVRAGEIELIEAYDWAGPEPTLTSTGDPEWHPPTAAGVSAAVAGGSPLPARF